MHVALIDACPTSVTALPLLKMATEINVACRLYVAGSHLHGTPPSPMYTDPYMLAVRD